MRERARREEGRRTRAVVLLQAAARGYLTRNKITPKLVALRERKRLEGERERRRAQAAIAIQAVWRGYRWVTQIFKATHAIDSSCCECAHVITYYIEITHVHCSC